MDRPIPGRRSGVVLVSGGLGGARLAPALRAVLGPGRLSVVANVGDDLPWLGLPVSPDVDSILYALAGVWDAERGWGRRDDTFRVRDEHSRLGLDSWFSLGDRDLAVQIMRADLLARGLSPTDACGQIARSLGVADVAVLPSSDQPCHTLVRLADGRLVHFQEWYVREGAQPEVRAVRFGSGVPSAAVLEALGRAEAVILGPSNPVSSVGAILELEGMRQAVRSVPVRVAVSPVAARIPVDDAGTRHHAIARSRLLAAVGLQDTPPSIASMYAGLVDWFVIDTRDRDDSEAIARLGPRPVVSRLLQARRLATDLARLVSAECVDDSAGARPSAPVLRLRA